MGMVRGWPFIIGLSEGFALNKGFKGIIIIIIIIIYLFIYLIFSFGILVCVNLIMQHKNKPFVESSMMTFNERIN